VVVAGLRKSYGAVQAVRGASFNVGPGEIFALLGPNGAGKTTTLEILEGFRARDAGRVEVLGLDPGDRSHGRALRERIGLVLQDIAVEPYLTVRETIARNAGYYPALRDVDEVIGLVGLAGQARRKVRALSGGQKRRLDLALGLIGRPELLFLDEPTTGFDPNARRDAWEIVDVVPGDGLVTVETAEPTRTLHQLTGWALRHGTVLDQLTVDRPSLEDIYLRLTDHDGPGPTTERSTR
jgi:ABC-2 type transport system ATP-binding protein